MCVAHGPSPEEVTGIYYGALESQVRLLVAGEQDSIPPHPGEAVMNLTI